MGRGVGIRERGPLPEDGGIGARGRPGAGSGQSTLEYLLVLLAFAAALGAISMLWHAGRDGVLVDLAVRSASHGSGQGVVAMLKDVVGY